VVLEKAGNGTFDVIVDGLAVFSRGGKYPFRGELARVIRQKVPGATKAKNLVQIPLTSGGLDDMVVKETKPRGNPGETLEDKR
jgi:hypothetical protein